MDVKLWLLLAYKVPPKKRIALWRKVKSLGAVYVQAGVCLLPKTADHVRRLKIERARSPPAGQNCLRASTRIATKPTRNFWSAAPRSRPKSRGNQRPAS
jgi:hypothetical protein